MATAFAIYSADDYSLTFYKRDTVPTAGSTFNGKTATAVYTGIETDTYDDDSPWGSSYSSYITNAAVADEGIQPVSTAYWFYFHNSMATLLDIWKLDTSNVTNMSHMFEQCDLGNLDLSTFDTSSVTDMSYMFQNCFLTSLDISGWDTSNVTNMDSVFSGCNLTTFDVSNWDTSKVTNMSGVFNSCDNLTTIDISGWDTSSVTDMSYMLSSCPSLTSLDLSNFDTSNVTNMANMFSYCTSLTTLNLSNFDTSNVTSMNYMFKNCSSLKTVYAGKEWSIAEVVASSLMFSNCTSLVGQSGQAYDSTKTDATMANWETGYLTYYKATGQYLIDADSLTAIGTAIREKADVSKLLSPAEMVTAIEGMGAWTLTIKGISNWSDLGSVHYIAPDGSCTQAAYTDTQTVKVAPYSTVLATSTLRITATGGNFQTITRSARTGFYIYDFVILGNNSTITLSSGGGSK